MKKRNLKKTEKDGCHELSPDKKGTKIPVKPEEEDKTDYGGLPQLDLKKNLGCG